MYIQSHFTMLKITVILLLIIDLEHEKIILRY